MKSIVKRQTVWTMFLIFCIMINFDDYQFQMIGEICKCLGFEMSSLTVWLSDLMINIKLYVTLYIYFYCIFSSFVSCTLGRVIKLLVSVARLVFNESGWVSWLNLNTYCSCYQIYRKNSKTNVRFFFEYYLFICYYSICRSYSINSYLLHLFYIDINYPFHHS
jgi:hypothetical protein